MWKWRHQILALFVALFIAVGLNLREEIPWLGFFFIGLGAVSLIILIDLLLKGRKKYGAAELASDMETMSTELADFVGERRSYDPINRIKMPKRDWDDNRKHEEWQEQTQEVIGYSSATRDIYRKRYGRKVIHLVEEAKKLGYQDNELDSVYKNPANILSIGMLSDRMGALSLTMRKDIE